jgi:hypothetical protein
MTDDFMSVTETAEVANAGTIDADVAAGYNFSLLRLHLRDVHHNEADDDLSNAEAVEQHHYGHHGPGGLRPHAHADRIPPTEWKTLDHHRADAVTEGPHPDIITMDRKIGATRASVTLVSGIVVTGDWAAGDCQALRRLVEILVKMTDNANEFSTRVNRGNSNLAADNRDLRNQLVVALNEVNDLHLAREHWTDQLGRVGQLMAEITTLKAQLGTAAANTTPEEAALLRQRTQAERARIAEKARADAAEAKVKELTQQLNIEVGWNTGAHDFIKRHAIDAAMATDQAFEEEAWENAGRLLKFANMWISLLAAADFSRETPPKEPRPSKWP